MITRGYKDERGQIVELLGKLDSDATIFISSVAGAKRANHYHKTSSHICFLTKGEVDYYEEHEGLVFKTTIGALAPFHSGPQTPHLMVFTQDSDMICLRIDGSKDQADYENDLVRLDYDLEEKYNEQRNRS